MITVEILKYLDSSVLCWLATSSSDGMPNVSPKEIFSKLDEDHIIIANIASPGSLRNIKENSKVCLSFINILEQRGFQLKGNATIVSKQDSTFEKLKLVLELQTEGLFPFQSIFKVKIASSKPILAPRYILFPETTVEEQIASAKKTYGL